MNYVTFSGAGRYEKAISRRSSCSGKLDRGGRAKGLGPVANIANIVSIVNIVKGVAVSVTFCNGVRYIFLLI